MSGKNLLWAAILLLPFCPSRAGEPAAIYSVSYPEANEMAESAEVTLTVLYDNYVHTERCKADWGFACLIESAAKTILFDTGTKSDILLQNAEILNRDLAAVETVVLSHNHGDHTGGLGAVLEAADGARVYFGANWPDDFDGSVEKNGGIAVRVSDPVEICPGIWSTGEISGPVYEQALVLDTRDGLTVVTGCSHPGIIKILNRAREVVSGEIDLVFGGFHLMRHSDAEVAEIIDAFRELNVHRCGPTHCTGDRAISLFRETFADAFTPIGVGREFKVNLATPSREAARRR